MSTPPARALGPAEPPSPLGRPPARQPLRRAVRGRVLGGVCAGLAGRLGLDPLVLRVGFVAAAAAGGFGLPLYALAWAVMPAEGSDRLPVSRVRGRPGSWRTAAGVGLLVLSALLVLRELGVWFSDAIVWPVVLAAAGAALIWRQSGSGASTASSEAEPLAVGSPPATREAPPARGPGLSRAGLGAALVIGAGLLFLQANDALRPARDVVLAVLVVVLGLALIFAPAWWRLVQNLRRERSERIRSEERAELAAHLHDSVLQTLALVQRRAGDPREVAALARRQERDLRAWLSGRPQPEPGESLAGALRAAAADVEEGHGVPVEVVTVGDCAVDARGDAVVAAAREALVNAAKFAGDAPIAVYAQVDQERVQVFVRDRGPGFDPSAVPADRHGVRESIIGRMERQGGRAVVHARPGAGTEVELVLEGSG